MAGEPRDGFIPADAIDAIRTLHHITVDRMLGLWVELDQVVRLLDAYVQPGAVPPRLLDAIDAILDNPDDLPDDEWDPAFIELREARRLAAPTTQASGPVSDPSDAPEKVDPNADQPPNWMRSGRHG